MFMVISYLCKFSQSKAASLDSATIGISVNEL
jgi:hypothetical protein